MTSSRPYLIRALYEWIISKENNMTPYIVINTEIPGVIVPTEYIERGKIILDISPQAVHDLVIDNTAVKFDAMFSGVSKQVYAPLASIITIYPHETGEGMVFGNEPGGPPPLPAATGKKPHLKIIK